jgi:hypothetical protein
MWRCNHNKLKHALDAPGSVFAIANSRSLHSTNATTLTMPGPRNSKKKRKQQAEKEKAKRMKNLLQEVLNTRRLEDELDTTRALEHEPASQTAIADPELRPSTSTHSHLPNESESTQTPLVSSADQRPFIHNPGNGPRVLNMPAYLSSFFVPPPALDDPLCAALAYRAYDVLAMLENTLGLPQEVALVRIVANSNSNSPKTCHRRKHHSYASEHNPRVSIDLFHYTDCLV